MGTMTRRPISPLAFTLVFGVVGLTACLFARWFGTWQDVAFSLLTAFAAAAFAIAIVRPAFDRFLQVTTDTGPVLRATARYAEISLHGLQAKRSEDETE